MKKNVVFPILTLSFITLTGAFAQAETNLSEAAIDDLSKRSLFVNIIRNDTVICHATGFLVKWRDKPYLITNWHVVTGHHPLDPTVYAVRNKPDSIRIIHHSKQPGIWINHGAESLYKSDGSPRYFEHPNKWVDVVALPLENYNEHLHELYFYDIALLKSPVTMTVGMPVFVIGFLEGLTGPGVFPLWKAGHIASEPNLKYQGNNAFLIDATTRGGMSGSPVVYRESDCCGKQGKMMFLGIYAGRLSQESEIGIVWTPDNIMEILEAIK